MSSPPEIRPARLSDAAEVAQLAEQWGYPSTVDATRQRLARLLASRAHHVLVAEIDGVVAGWVTGEIRSSLGSEPRAEITGLIVSTVHRLAGAGRALVAAIETWGRSEGCHELFVRSNVTRPEAHPFYERLGFSRTKTQHAYARPLRPVPVAQRTTSPAEKANSHVATVRRLLPDDAAAFQALRLRGLLETPSAFSSSHAEEVATPVAEIARRLEPRKDGAVLGAFRDETLVGIIGVQREHHQQLSHKAFLWGMCVAPESRREGVARLLVSEALRIAAAELGVRTVNLGVNTRNDAAVGLYRSMGFRTYGIETGFLMINGELHDEYLMTRLVAAPERAIPG